MTMGESNGQLQLAFDYGDLPAAQARKLEGRAKRVRGELGKMMRSRLEIGKELAAAQDELAHRGNGTFGKWLAFHFADDISRASAYDWISRYRALNVQNLDKLSDKAASLLTKDDTPDEATQEAIKRAEDGEKITAAVAKQIISQFVADDEDDEQEPETDNGYLEDEDERFFSACDRVRSAFSEWQPEHLSEINQILEHLMREDQQTWLQ